MVDEFPVKMCVEPVGTEILIGTTRNVNQRLLSDGTHEFEEFVEG